MRIDLPLCDFVNCRVCFDGNCTSKSKYENCEYARVKALKEEQITHCKDCVWYHAEHILLNDGTERPYTDDDVDGLGIPHSVTIDVGINCGGMCEYRNREYCFMEENDFCSRAEREEE